MEHENDALNNRVIAQTAKTSDKAGARPAANGNWVLVNCGLYGVRPRRVQGQFPQAALDRAPRF